MDDDFRILFDYVEQMKRELQDKADLQAKSAEDEEKKCVHESIETEEAYVCCKCGLVLEDIFQPDIHWCDHALIPRIYGGADRLNAMHKVLIKFLDKISFCTYLPMYHWRNDSAIWRSTAASRILTMRSAWCASSKEMNRLNNKSVHTCPVQTWPGQEVFIYSHLYPRYSWETGWEICSNQLEEPSPIDRKNVSLTRQFQALRRRRTSNDAGSDFILPRRFRLEYEWSRKTTHSIKTCTLPLFCSCV